MFIEVPREASDDGEPQRTRSVIRSSTRCIRPTDDEIARNKPRTRALRSIPSTDTDFAALYGVRNDTESKHHIMKQALPNKRLNVVGLNRVKLRMHAWQLAVTLGAALA